MTLPLLAALPVLAAYAALLPAGRWQGDEYWLGWSIAQHGWDALLDRVTGRSPRPLAELLTYVYLSLSNAIERPLVGYFLAFLWLASLAGVAIIGWAGRVRQPVMLAVLLFVLLLLLAKPGEMFYWPMGAAAYLSCWAGLAAATMLHRTTNGQHWIALTLSLSVAALSAEIGALTVLFYVIPVGVVFFRRRLMYRLRPLILPALGAAVVCLVVLHGRMQSYEVMDAESGLAGSWPASLLAAVPTFARKAADVRGTPLLAGAAIKLLLLVCLAPGEQQADQEQRRLSVLWAVALLLGVFASVVLAYHQFGTLCCERHATMRQGMLILALATASGLCSSALLLQRQIVLAALLVVLLAIRAVPLYADWHMMSDILAARQRTWQSARNHGDTMTLFVVPASQILNSEALPAGRFSRFSDSVADIPFYASAIMNRFGKQAVIIAPLVR